MRSYWLKIHAINIYRKVYPNRLLLSNFASWKVSWKAYECSMPHQPVVGVLMSHRIFLQNGQFNANHIYAKESKSDQYLKIDIKWQSFHILWWNIIYIARKNERAYIDWDQPKLCKINNDPLLRYNKFHDDTYIW